MKNNKQSEFKSDYTKLKTKLLLNLFGMFFIAFLLFFIFYITIWKGNGSDWVVSVLQNLLGISYDTAMTYFQQIFRNNMDWIMIFVIILIYFVLLLFFINWITRYLDFINEGIESLLKENDQAISLPSEMAVIEQKLNTVKQTLKQRELAVQLAEQRKNELVMYLAHDIRTPLTSIIGYLSLLEEAPDMPAEQKAKYVHITLDKAYRLESMIGEFFEITRYNLQQIVLMKDNIDLYYMLLQLTDELSTALNKNENTVELIADESISIYGDGDKLARVFNNVLKNAAAYSFPKTKITIKAELQQNEVIISFKNHGRTIPKEKLTTLFDKFFRMDESRTSNTGGAGLGLAIAKEIVTLHGGSIHAFSEHETITFTIILPALSS